MATTRTSPETWNLGVAALCEQGHRESTARVFLGALMREWPEQTVRDAILVSLGRADFRSYIVAVLKGKPKKHHRLRHQVQLELGNASPQATPPTDAREKIAAARALLKARGR